MDHYAEAWAATEGAYWRMVTAPDGTGHPTFCPGSSPKGWGQVKGTRQNRANRVHDRPVDSQPVTGG